MLEKIPLLISYNLLFYELYIIDLEYRYFNIFVICHFSGGYVLPKGNLWIKVFLGLVSRTKYMPEQTEIFV